MPVDVSKYKRRITKKSTVKKVLTQDEFIDTLPSPSEVPKVTKTQLLRMYNSFANGIEEEELLDEIESRLLVRAEVFVILNDLYDGNRYCSEWPAKQEFIKIGNKNVFCSIDYNFILDKIREYGMILTDNYYSIDERYMDMIKAKKKNFKSRMIAVDNLINETHIAEGSLAYAFIEGKDELDVEKFLDKLSGIIKKRG